jgi:hypothetical protein
MIEQKNRVTGRSKIPRMQKNGDFWATCVVVGRPSNLVDIEVFEARYFDDNVV